ncbi:MAG: rod-binding protein [Caulobacterales bacterium]|nr:rod-binding protein [Caulobacterales bacterium]
MSSALLSPASVAATFLKPTPTVALGSSPATAAGAANDAQKARAKEAGQKFESQFLSSMFQQMFQGIQSDGPFGGGFGEEMFRSVMTDAMAKQVVKAGGVGVADTVQREILKMQGLK